MPPRKLSEIPHELRHPSAPQPQNQLYGMQQQQHANSAPPVLPAVQPPHPAFMPPTPKATVDDLMQIFGTSGDVSNPTTAPAPAPPPPPPMAFAQPALDPFRSMNSFNPTMMPGVGAGDFNTLFPDSFNFDEVRLHRSTAADGPVYASAMGGRLPAYGVHSHGGQPLRLALPGSRTTKQPRRHELQSGSARPDLCPTYHGVFHTSAHIGAHDPTPRAAHEALPRVAFRSCRRTGQADQFSRRL